MTLFGRTDTLRALADVVSTERLVTLVGPSGIGKTKLAEALAFRGDKKTTYVVSLERLPASQEEAIADRLADLAGRPVVGNTQEGGIADAVHVLLRDCQLLVLDGADESVSLLGTLIPRWLESNANLHVVATSRTPLDLSDEQLFAVPPLEMSDADAFFVAKARNVDPKFTPTDRGSLTRILESTAGLPLAVELAAAQMRVKTCAELAAVLEGNEHRLEGNRRDAPHRHRSLSAAIATSVDALDARASRLFSVVGAFAGNLSRHALCSVASERVASDEKERDPNDFSVALDELVHASLLTPIRTDHGMRFSILRPIHAFAKNALAQRDDVELIRTAHASWFAENWTPLLSVPPDDVADLQLARETLGARVEDRGAQVRCTLALISEAIGRGAAHDVKKNLDQMSLDDVAPTIEATGWCARARHGLVFLGTSMSREIERANAAHVKACSSPKLTQHDAANAVDIAALIALDHRIQGSARVEDVFDAALQQAKALGHAPWVHRIRSDFAAAMFERRNLSTSKALFLEVIDDALSSGDKASEGIARTNLALVLQELGALDAARTSMLHALELHREVGHSRFEAITLSDLGALSVEQSLWRSAKNEFTAAVAALAELGDVRHEAIGRSALAFVLTLLGDEDAAELEAKRAKRRLAADDNDPFSLVIALHACGREAARNAAQRIVSGKPVGDEAALAEKLGSLSNAAIGSKSDEVRLAHRLAAVALKAVTDSGLAVTVDGVRYWSAQGDVDLREKKAHQRIFSALVDNRLSDPVGLEKASLIDAGWPDEKMVEASARNRLHVAIAGLRKSGVGDAIALEDGRYRLTPNAPLVIVASDA